MSNKFGVCLGRFQPFHKGHSSCIKLALSECENVLVLIGSAQEQRTQKNPLSFLERKTVITHSLEEEKVDMDRVMIAGLDDLNSFNETEWGSYLYYNIANIVSYDKFRYYCSENEQSTDIWFSNIPTNKVIVRTLNRDEIKISSTRIRQAILDNDIQFIKQNCYKFVQDNYIWFKDIINTVYNINTPIIQSVSVKFKN